MKQDDDKIKVDEPKRPKSIKKKGKVFAEDVEEENLMREGLDSHWLIESPIIEKNYWSDSHAAKIKVIPKRQTRIGVNDFEKIDLISRGAFGRVFLVKRKEDR